MQISKESLRRTLIIGNSGSGKTYLATKLAEQLQSEVIHFDQLFWEPGSFEKKRPKEVVLEENKTLSMSKSWIMEGVFGSLAAAALSNTTTLIYLSHTWDDCKIALLDRGCQPEKQSNLETAEKNFAELLTWAADYEFRENSGSRKGHLNLFEPFSGFKLQLHNRSEANDLISSLSFPS